MVRSALKWVAGLGILLVVVILAYEGDLHQAYIRHHLTEDQVNLARSNREAVLLSNPRKGDLLVFLGGRTGVITEVDPAHGTLKVNFLVAERPQVSIDLHDDLQMMLVQRVVHPGSESFTNLRQCLLSSPTDKRIACF